MDFSLSNSLVGNAVLGGDGLSLDLQFATDKTLAARKGPTPAFTRGSSATFVGSNGLIQSAGNDVARFDHDPVSLACNGLLIEESGTNNATQSGAMNLWSGAGGSTRSASTTLSPDGIGFATLATSGGLTYGGIVARSLSWLTTVTGARYTASCFVKKDNYRYISLDFEPLRMSGPTMPFFDLDTLLFNANGSAATGSVKAFPNGWYRIAISGAALRVLTTGFDINLTSSTGNGGGTIGAGKNIYVWGAQLEAGADATNYIPTTTASAVRSADVCSITGAAFSGFYNQEEGSFSCVTTKPSTNSNSFIVHASDGTFDNAIDMRYNTATQAGSIMNVSNVTQFSLASTISASALVKQSVGYKIDDCAYSANSGSVITDTSASIPTTNRMVIGNSAAGGSYYLNGTVSSIRYYKKRLPNAKLQALTA